MDAEGFRSLLEERGCDAKAVEESLAMAARFERFVSHRDRTPETATVADIRAFSRLLVEGGENEFPAYLALARFAHHVGAREVFLEVLSFVDGAEALPNLVARVGERYGGEVAERMLGDVILPPLGTPVEALPAYAEAVLDRLSCSLEPDEVRGLLADGLRDLEDTWFEKARQAFADLGDIDDFLAWRRQDFIATLERCRDSDTLFFSQPVTDAVLDLVTSRPEMSTGVREGSTIYEMKIPHQAAEWIAEPDPERKRRLYCHCPWVKESLADDQVAVPAAFCNCSAGFHKKFWEVALGRPLTAEVVESVLAGDDRCLIAIRLPDDVIQSD